MNTIAAVFVYLEVQLCFRYSEIRLSTYSRSSAVISSSVVTGNLLLGVQSTKGSEKWFCKYVIKVSGRGGVFEICIDGLKSVIFLLAFLRL